MSNQDSFFHSDELDNVAAFWMVRLDSPDCTPQDRVAFEKWKREHTSHEEAYEKLRRGNAVMDLMLDDERILDLVEVARGETAPKAQRWNRTAILAMAASLAVVVGTLAFVSPSAINQQSTETILAGSTSTIYETAIGERSTIPLTDGSIVTLNTDSAIEVHFSEQQRRIELRRGQGYFEVAKDTDRPFVVDAGDRKIIALGTEFDVRYKDAGLVEVMLVEGAVDVTSRETSLTMSKRSILKAGKVSLVPGERLLAGNIDTPQIIQANTNEETFWRQGKVVFRDRALDEVIAEMNRYSSQKIIMSDDPRLRTLKISGVFNTGRTSTFVTALEGLHPLKVDQSDESQIVLAWTE